MALKSTSFFKVPVVAQPGQPPEAAPGLVIHPKADSASGALFQLLYSGENSRWSVFRVYQCEVPHYVWRRTPYLGVPSVDEPGPPDALPSRPAGVRHEMLGPMADRSTPT